MTHSPRYLRKAGAVAASAALAATAFASLPAQADTPTTPAGTPLVRPANTDTGGVKLTSRWLASQLKGGLVVGEYGNDYGLTIDMGLALVEAGEKRPVGIMDGVLQRKLGEYVGTGGEVYGGATAKAAVFARAAGGNPTSYGGMNLITRIEGQVADTGPTAGRLSDTSTYGDYANVVGQSFAVRALSRANSPEADTALGFLLAQQCASGYFRLNFDKPDNATQNCEEGAAGSQADLDATGLVISNLARSGKRSQPMKDAMERGSAWLASQQRARGAFTGSGPTAIPNTNSTAVAGYALGLTGRVEEAAKAARWVRSLQPVDRFKCRSALSRDLGAVAYVQSDVKKARVSGIGDAERDQWRRATAQAAHVLQFAPASPDNFRVKSSRARARSGDKVRMRIFGVAPGQRACVQVKRDFRRVVGKPSGGRVIRGLRMPNGNARRFVLLRSPGNTVRTRVIVRN